MLVAGIDVGAKNVHAVLLRDGVPIARVVVASGFDHEGSAGRGLDEAAALAGVRKEDIDRVAATGAGRKALVFAADQPTEIAADARGAFALFPPARTVIDVGADEARAIRLGPGGKVVDFAINEKCAAGAGAFVEAMSRALEMSLEEFARVSLDSTEVIPMNAQCTVFAESEVVSLIHANTPPADIARAVHDAMAGRVSTVVRRIGIEDPVVLGGGTALNAGFVKSLSCALGGVAIQVLGEAPYLGAHGAALIAWDAAQGA
ncbi:MAG: acyl-CoA dehydratase activase [Actinomycetia bacterium]|nr:acyl-CoA dehydratase activase [Actinomycetes bacterium]